MDLSLTELFIMSVVLLILFGARQLPIWARSSRENAEDSDVDSQIVDNR